MSPSEREEDEFTDDMDEIEEEAHAGEVRETYQCNSAEIKMKSGLISVSHGVN